MTDLTTKITKNHEKKQIHRWDTESAKETVVKSERREDCWL